MLELLLPLLPTVFSVFLPTFADGFRSVIGWLTGSSGALPQNVDEAIRLIEADTRKLEAVARLDMPTGNISLWVANLRASFRYIAAGVILVPFPFLLGYVSWFPTDAAIEVFNLYSAALVGPVFGFMFGDRLLLKLRTSGK